jgi:biotin carboxylase
MVGCILVKKKSILIISGGEEAVPGIIRAKEMGLNVIVSDLNPSAPGMQRADDHIVASTYDFLETAKLAKRYSEEVCKIDGVIAMAADVPYTVAYVAKILGTPGLSLKTATLSTDKIKMKNKLLEMNIPIPLYWEISNYVDLVKLIDAQGFPLIIKPVDSRGSRGVFLLKDSKMLRWSFNNSKMESPSGRVMVEEYLVGAQISTEALIVNGIGYPIGFSDRNYEYLEKFSPYIIENGGDMPSSLSGVDQQKVSSMAINAGIALGVQDGVIKGDMVLTKKGPKVIEIATRLSGGWFSTDQIPQGTGVDLIGASINQSLGEKIDTNQLIPTMNKGVAIRYIFPKPGIVSAILNADKIGDKEGIYKIGFFVTVGDTISMITNHTSRAGFVIAVGSNKQEAIQRAESAVKAIKIQTR